MIRESERPTLIRYLKITWPMYLGLAFACISFGMMIEPERVGDWYASLGYYVRIGIAAIPLALAYGCMFIQEWWDERNKNK